MSDLISQAAQQLPSLRWTEGDPVSLSFRVNTNWSGSYISQIRKEHKKSGTLVGSLTVTATWDALAGETTFTLSMTEIASLLIPTGNYFTDIQVVGGITRLWACVIVDPQVTFV